jgi:hypothetical protein
MAVCFYPISTRSSVLIAPMDPDYGLRRTDGILLSILPDAKVELDLLTAAIVYQDYGCFKANGGGDGMEGGFCGGIEGAMIEGVVKPLGAWMVYRDSFSYTGVGRLPGAKITSLQVRPELCWATSVVTKALTEHTGIICYRGGNNGASGQSGPGTQTHLYNVAMIGIQSVLTGCNINGFGQNRGRLNSRRTHFEGQVMYEAGRAAQLAGLNQQNSVKVLEALAGKINGRAPEPALPATECIDLVHCKPSPAYYEIYLRLKNDLARVGVNLDDVNVGPG